MTQIIIIVLLGTFTIAIFAGIHQLSKRADEAKIQRHTKEQHLSALKGHYGDKGFNLYAALGDALDKKAAWVKPMDILFDVFENNPQLLLEYLIEGWGAEAVQEALDDYKDR